MKRLVLILLFVTVAACSPPKPPETSSTGTQPPPAPAREVPWQRCTNATHAFTVSYPPGWHTNDGKILPGCTVFDPNPIDLPAGSEIPFDLAVQFTLENGPLTDKETSTRWERVLSSERITVSGRAALRVETEATGEGLADRGMRSFRYVVDIGGGRLLTASTHNVTPSYEEHKKTLARMMETFSVSPEK